MQKTRIILINDHLLFREGIKRILQVEPSFEIVGEGTHGREAISLVDSLKPDIVLMVVDMPIMKEIDALKHIVSTNPNTKVMFLSIHEDESYVLDLLKSGASAYLLIEISPDELVRAIKQVVNGKKYLHPKVSGFVIDALVGNWNAKSPRHLLTSRECDVLQLLAKGYSNRTIAEHLQISDKTVKNHLSSIFEKLCVNDRTQAVLTAITNNWVQL